MASSGAHSFSVDECMDLEMVGEVARQHDVGFIGNFRTTPVLFEETESASGDAKRCLDIGGQFPGYVFGLGAPITQHIDSARLTEAVTFLRSHGTSG